MSVIGRCGGTDDFQGEFKESIEELIGTVTVFGALDQCIFSCEENS